MLPEFSLAGRTALVTGGGRGLGRTIALVFAEAGAEVVVTARSAHQVEAVAAEIEAGGGTALALVCDVADSAQVDSTVLEATERLGKIDVLVNNAGEVTVGPTVPVPDPPENVDWRWPSDQRMSDADFRRIIGTNLEGAFYMARAVAPQMIERRSGKVINVASTSANLAFPYEAAYGPSKAAVQMLTKVLALEWGAYNVNVNAISPGWFRDRDDRTRIQRPGDRRATDRIASAGTPYRRARSGPAGRLPGKPRLRLDDRPGHRARRRRVRYCLRQLVSTWWPGRGSGPGVNPVHHTRLEPGSPDRSPRGPLHSCTQSGLPGMTPQLLP